MNRDHEFMPNPLNLLFCVHCGMTREAHIETKKIEPRFRVMIAYQLVMKHDVVVEVYDPVSGALMRRDFVFSSNNQKEAEECQVSILNDMKQRGRDFSLGKPAFIGDWN